MITLAIETSCDETAVCLLETKGVQIGDISKAIYTILGNLVHSQIELHRKYGGVFPAMAKREHSKNLVPLLEALITESGIPMEKIKVAGDGAASANNTVDALANLQFLNEKEPELLNNIMTSRLLTEKPVIDQIAVTRGPGLEPALWVGVNCAQALGKLWNVPVVGVNHMEGHILGSFIDSSIENKGTPRTFRSVTFPTLALLVSGGHTELALVKAIGDYEIIGRTKDDAVGEAFDKVARMLDLPYPGGVEISKRAEKNRSENASSALQFPRPMIHSHDFDFSFSGLKTAVLYTLRNDKSGGLGKTDRSEDYKKNITEKIREEVAREFEDAVTDVLVAKTKKVLEKYAEDGAPIQNIVMGGGVSANKHIRASLEKLATTYSIPLYLPPDGVSGDNALMIALVAALNPQSGSDALKAHGNLVL